MADKSENVSNSEIMSELKAIRQSVSDMQQQMVAVSHQPILTQESVKKIENEGAKKQSRETSKMTLTIAFTLLGAKIGGALGLKGGLGKHYLKQIFSPNTAKASVEAVEAAVPAAAEAAKLISPAMAKTAMIWTGAGAAVGAIAGGMLGWKRGDRIEHPADLISKPLDSLGKLFGPEPSKPEDKNAALTGKTWESKLAEQQAAAKSVSVSR